MPSLLFVAFIAITFLQGTFGAPPCASNAMGSCISRCNAKHHIGHHTWGSSYAPNPSTPTSSAGSQPTTPAVKGTPDSGKVLEPASTPSPTTQPAPTSTPSAASSSKPASSTPGSSDSSSSVSPSDIDAYLSAHNSVRKNHGAAPLTWNDTLSSAAQEWAGGCVFQHSNGRWPYGENLAAGTGTGFGIPQAIKLWTDEASSYDPNNPQPSHFTQVVWRATTQVGCALIDCNDLRQSNLGHANFVVCEYYPAGNVIGRFGQNVQP